MCAVHVLCHPSFKRLQYLEDVGEDESVTFGNLSLGRTYDQLTT